MDTPMYAPFVQLGALAVFALLMFLMNRSLVTRVLNQSAAREIAERAEGAKQLEGALASQERIVVVLDNHLTTLYANQAAVLENQRGMAQSLTDHDQRESAAWARLLDRLDALVVATRPVRGVKKGA